MSRDPVDRAENVVVGLITLALFAGSGWCFWASRHGDPAAINGALGMGICGVVMLVGFLMLVLG